MNVIKSINERVKYLRKDILNLTQEIFAEKIMLKRNSLAQIEIGRNSITDRTIADICREFNVNEDWLRVGQGEIFIEQPTDELDALSKRYGLDEPSRSILEAFLNLSISDKQAIINFVENIKTSKDNLMSNDVEISEELASNYSKLSDESKRDVVSYSETLLLNEKFDQTRVKKSENIVHTKDTRRNQA